MEIPECTLYKDLHGDVNIPSISFDSLQTYLKTADKRMDNKAKILYDERFLMCVRFANAWPPLLLQYGTEQHVFAIFTLKIMFIMARLTVVRGPLCFCLVRPSVWGVFDVFDFCPYVRACMRALRSMY